MTDLLNKENHNAIFKYGIISEIVTGLIPKGNVNKKIKELSQKKFISPFNGKEIKIGVSTIYRYLKLYREKGIEGLKRKLRKDKNIPKAISEEIITKAISLRKEVATRTTQTIIEILKEIFHIEKIAKSTLNYHFAKRGYSRRQLKTIADKIFIRFESKVPNHLWIGDYHDKRGLLKDGREVHLSAFIDCKTRYITHAEYYIKENLFTLEDSFKKAVLKHGCPKLLFLDNAKIYHSKRFAYCCLKLGVNPPIFSKPYEKESRGKIEKWFEFISLNFEPEVIANGGYATVDELNEHLKAFVEIRYHSNIHSETKKTPAAAYAELKEKNYPDIEILNELFMLTDNRTVHPKTKTVSVLGTLFVTDSYLGGKKIEVHFNPNDLSYVLIYYKNIFIMKASPQELNAKPHEKIVPEKTDENFKYDYLAALKGMYDKFLKENASLMNYSSLPKPSNEKLYYHQFENLFTQKLNKKLTEFDIQNLNGFFATYRPENIEIINQALSFATRKYGINRHITFYLNCIKLFLFQKRSVTL